MGLIVKSRSGGGSVNIVPATTSGNYTITFPNVNSSVVYSGLAPCGSANASNGVTVIASGNTAQRPLNPIGGMIRHNTEISKIEYYNSSTSSWISI